MPDRPTYRPVYKALHRPLTICGVDRRLFFLALLLGAATFNLFYSFLAGLLMFGGLYGFALWATAIATRRCSRFYSLRRRRAGATTPASTIASMWRWRRGERRAHSPRLPRCRQREQPAGALGIRRRGTFLTKAGPRRRGLRLRGVDYEGLSHPQRRALTHRFEAALRLLDEHCRVYQYLLKRTAARSLPTLPTAVAERSHPAARRVLERAPARPVRPLAVPGAALRGAACGAEEHRLRGMWRAPGEALRAWLSDRIMPCGSSNRSSTARSGRCTTRPRPSRCS
jgi:hypothetical protein